MTDIYRIQDPLIVHVGPNSDIECAVFDCGPVWNGSLLPVRRSFRIAFDRSGVTRSLSCQVGVDSKAEDASDTLVHWANILISKEEPE